MKLIISDKKYVLLVKHKNKNEYYEFDKEGNYISKYESHIIKKLKPLKRIGGQNVKNIL